MASSLFAGIPLEGSGARALDADLYGAEQLGMDVENLSATGNLNIGNVLQYDEHAQRYMTGSALNQDQHVTPLTTSFLANDMPFQELPALRNIPSLPTDTNEVAQGFETTSLFNNLSRPSEPPVVPEPPPSQPSSFASSAQSSNGTTSTTTSTTTIINNSEEQNCCCGCSGLNINILNDLDITNLATTILTPIINLVGDVTNILLEITGPVINLVEDVTNIVLDITGPVTNLLNDTVTEVTNIVGDVIGPVTTLLGDTANNVTTITENILEPVINNVTTITTDLTDITTDILNETVNNVTSITSDVTDIVTETVSNVTTITKTVINELPEIPNLPELPDLQVLSPLLDVNAALLSDAFPAANDSTLINVDLGLASHTDSTPQAAGISLLDVDASVLSMPEENSGATDALSVTVNPNAITQYLLPDTELPVIGEDIPLPTAEEVPLVQEAIHMVENAGDTVENALLDVLDPHTDLALLQNDTPVIGMVDAGVLFSSVTAVIGGGNTTPPPPQDSPSIENALQLVTHGLFG